ncbi:hypothetical protein GC209_13120 [bacterium]|nr:hypothetical protein [bacterium]
MNIAFIGAGKVGGALADQVQRAGHLVTLAARDPGSESVAALLALNPAIGVASPAEAVTAAEVVFVATPAMAAEAAVRALGDALNGKVIVDCTNPVGPGLSHALDSRTSSSAVLQAAAPGAAVVKAFTIYGVEVLRDHRFGGQRPAMMFCGDDAAAKAKVADLIEALGWQPFDVGGLAQAVHLEHMTLLWIRLVRVNGHSPDLAWAALTR